MLVSLSKPRRSCFLQLRGFKRSTRLSVFVGLLSLRQSPARSRCLRRFALVEPVLRTRGVLDGLPHLPVLDSSCIQVWCGTPRVLSPTREVLLALALVLL